MGGIRGSERFQRYSDRIASSLREHNRETHPPDAQKVLRPFSMREAGDFLRVNPNSFRRYVKTLEGKMPTGTLVNGNRRYFTAEDIAAIQDFLWQDGKLDLRQYPRRQAHESLQAITVFNLKGGVSKTTIATNLGQLLSLRGYRVLLIDLDAQASMTNLFGLQPEMSPDMPSVYDVIRYDDPVPVREAIRPTYFPRIDILPASMDVVEFEYETALSFRDMARTAPFHTRISAALAEVENDYDLVIFDTPPQMSFAVISALIASTGVLIPLNAAMLDVMSLSTFLSMAGDLMAVVEAQSAEKTFDFLRFLITRYESTDGPQVQMASYLRTMLGDAVMSSALIKSTAINDAANTTQPVLEVEPKDFNRRTYERLVESLTQIADELERDIYHAWGRTTKELRYGT